MLKKLIASGSVSIIIFLFLAFFNPVKAQLSSTDFSQKFADGNLNLLYENYPAAISNFEDLYASDSTNANVCYKLGLAYFKSSSQKEKAIKYLEKAIKNTTKNYTEFSALERKAPEICFSTIADAYHFNYEFDKAIANYEKYITLITPKSNQFEKAKYQIAVCNFAKELVKMPLQISIKSIGDSINSSFSDYCPLVSANETVMIFTSRRQDKIGPETNKYEQNIFTSYKENGVWEKAKKISNTTSFLNTAAIGLSVDGQKLLLFKDENGDGNIYESELFGESWSFPEKLGGDINTKSWERSASFSADGNTIYFTSNRKGGYGGMDIYKSTKLPNGEWSLSTNLGPTINTIYDEEAPFIHPDGTTLFFSSKGHKNMGGYDIFFSYLGTNDTWSEPLNIGYPINTTGDDIFFVTSPSNKRAYYSSEKSGGIGEKDIYTIDMPDNREPALTLLKGFISVKNGNQQLLSDVRITATEIENERLEGIYKPLVRNGSYAIILPPNKNYRIDYKLNDSIFFSDKLFINANTAYNEINKAIDLKSVEIDTVPKPTPMLASAENSKDRTKEVSKEKKLPAPNVKEEKKDIPIAKEQIASNSQVEPVTTKEKKQSQPVSKVVTTVDTENITGAGDIYTFTMYPNVSKINISDSQFEKLIARLEQLAKEKGKVSIAIEASSSKVPTKSYANNYVLSRRRANDTKTILSRVLAVKNLDEKIVYPEAKMLVQGEEYQGDYKENKMKYDQYQYIKVILY